MQWSGASRIVAGVRSIVAARHARRVYEARAPRCSFSNALGTDDRPLIVDSPLRGSNLGRLVNARMEKALISSVRTHLLVHVARRVQEMPGVSKFRRSWPNETRLEFVLIDLLDELHRAGVDVANMRHHDLLQRAIGKVDQMLEEEIVSRGSWLEDPRMGTRDALLTQSDASREVAPALFAEADPTKKTQPSSTFIEPGLFVEQLQLESDAVESAVARYRALSESVTKIGHGASLKPAQQLLLSWFNPLVDAIEAEQQRIIDMLPGTDRRVYGPFLLQLPPPELACILMHETLGVILRDPIVGGGVRFARLALAIGSAVNAEVNMRRLRTNKNEWRTFKEESKRRQRPITSTAINMYARLRLTEGLWSTRVVVKVGAALLQQLLDVAVVKDHVSGRKGDPDSDKPVKAFTHEIITVNSASRLIQLGIIKCHPAVTTIIRDGHVVFEALHPRYLPMLVRPRPWISYNEGGYLTLRSIIMRTRGSRSQLDSLRRAELTSLFAGLNVVAEVPWRINKPVFRVMEHMWEHGGGRCELPRRADDPLPPEPTVPEAEQPALWKKWRSECREVNKINRDLHSLRCDAQYKLEVARAFQDKAEFYFPCNLDFRGRAYPIPPHLNHIGADLARGILCFAEGKKLGERGLWWVKVHLANLCGFDKASFEDRVAFTEARMPDIMRAAEDPLKNDWWTEVESPWQCLATCFELAEALKLPNPADHVSHLPIHQDGSCNGLQHYAALGRDEAGGTAVNLTPGTKPNDVYMDVCKLVNAQVEKDAEAGNPIAKRLLGKITRKVVKQTVMTSVYGVTWVGARAQINARLDEIFTPSSERMQNFKASGYLAKITLDSLANLFTSAREIMNWLGECAQTVAMQGQPMSWVTPLGLPVVQPYRKRSHLHVQTLIQTVTLVDHNDQLPVSPQRQRSAFPPNFVHSLDSTHMLMTALECRDLGVTFTSVHDSFWTHACSVDVMNEALRRQFVQLYTSPILENLRDALARRFPEATFPPVPKRGSLDLGKVMASRYFFS